jgi:D-alanyl-D-alanine carboxypeptidase
MSCAYRKLDTPSQHRVRFAAGMSFGRAAIVLVASVALGLAGYHALASPSASSAPTSESVAQDTVPPIGQPDRALPGAVLGAQDGVVAAGTTVFSDVPAVTRLNPALRRALRAAAAQAPRLLVNSGWRSTAYQQRLFDRAVAEYGSRAKAARWVAPPAKSSHVSGDAVDVGPASSAAWLSKYGAAWGLCRIYRNEPWHFELRPAAVSRGCPAMYADPSDDPRMQ